MISGEQPNQKNAHELSVKIIIKMVPKRLSEYRLSGTFQKDHSCKWLQDMTYWKIMKLTHTTYLLSKLENPLLFEDIFLFAFLFHFSNFWFMAATSANSTLFLVCSWLGSLGCLSIFGEGCGELSTGTSIARAPTPPP